MAVQWGAARSGFYGREREYLDLVLAVAPVGSTILDLGCGSGSPMAEYVVSQGRRVVGVDQSESLLEMARKTLPNEEWVLSSMEAFEPQGDYAGALIWDSLFHVERTLHEGILKKVVLGLAKGGRLMVTVGGSANPAFLDTMFGEDFFYDSHTPEETELLFQKVGCRIVLGEFMNLPSGGRDKGRYAIVAEKL